MLALDCCSFFKAADPDQLQNLEKFKSPFKTNYMVGRGAITLDLTGLKKACRNRGYVLENLIGKGGMSHIWLAKSKEDQKVVVKVASETPEASERLRFEAELLAKLSHEHIIRYVDSFDVSTLPVLIIEFARGSNLERAAAGVSLDENDAMVRTLEMLLAVDYIHSVNVVHRDIKPKNIIVGDEKTYLKMIDFGTATYLHRSGVALAVTSPGGYTPPEQYRFMASPEGDIWSVGATLFFMLTGQHPSVGMPGYPENPCPPPDPRKWKSEISDEAAETVARAMMWDPTDRFSTAMEMIMFIEKRAPPPPPAVPTIEVFGRSIRIETPRLLFGRFAQDGGTTTEESKRLLEGGEKVRVIKDERSTYVYVHDPSRWVSRKHFEIFEEGGKWHIRDLGSLNRTAVYHRGSVKEVWAGYMKVSSPLELNPGSIIYVAYGSSIDASSKACVVVTFK